MQSTWLFVGLALVLIGLLIVVVWSFSANMSSQWVFGGLLGPDSFGYASDPMMFYAVIILVALLVVLSLAIVWLR